MTSLTAYADSQYYVREAVAKSATAAGRVVGALAVWREAKAAKQQALLVEAAANRRVELYQEALDQLGMAEYTGETAASGTDLQAMEHQVEVVQFGEVAANDTNAGLQGAQWALKVSERHVQAAEATVAATRQSALRAARLYSLAQVQVLTSRLAVLKAKQWATVAGLAPAQPVEALVRLEGPLAPPLHAAWVVFDLPTTTTTTTLPSAPPLPKVCPPTTLALPPAGVKSASAPPTTASTATTTGASPGTARTAPAAATAVAVPVGTASTTTTVAVSVASPGDADGSPTSSITSSTTVAPVLGADCDAPNLSTAGPTILGPSLLTAFQIEGWFASTGAEPNVTVPMDRLINDYLKAGKFTGVRADIAFAQSVVETGYFSFPTFGQDPRSYNNFAGIGACDSCKRGFRFGSAMGGVIAQQELLNEYAAPSEMASGPGSGAGNLGVAGCCQTWMGLAGVWASAPDYGYAILSVYKLMLDWALRSELQTVGLTPASVAGMGDAGETSATGTPETTVAAAQPLQPGTPTTTVATGTQLPGTTTTAAP
jgi:hypothetical protein